MKRVTTFLTIACLAGLAQAADWPQWRGPARTGVSEETGLPARWTTEGENLLWRIDLVGRSTPVVFAGRVCANGRAGEEELRQEMVACFDAESGEKLWEFRFNVYHSSVPWTRVGWANLAGDPETGYLYAQGVGGHFYCFDSATGEVVWSRRFIEEFGFMEGYGGRTQTPFVDEDRLIVTFSNTSWGPEGKPLHRFRAFDKRTGELLWVASPAPSQADKNTQSTPNVMVVDGRRLIVAGNGGGGIYAVEARTGEPVWGFQLSKRGINTSVVVSGDAVFAAHSEENVDEASMGRVVAIDATGSGDVTATHERWRAPLGVGYSSPLLHDGRLYVVDNSANLHALDAATGEHLWELNVGRVGKGSPVWADGRIYVTEVNGRFVIVEPGDDEGRILHAEEILTPAGRPAEIYSSPAVAYGRIYFTTEEGLYAIGDPARAFDVEASAPSQPAEAPAPEGAVPATIRVAPYEIVATAGGRYDFRVEAFDEKGRALGPRSADWSLDGLPGSLSESVYTPAEGAPSHTGHVVARFGDLEARARVRYVQPLPLREDFGDVDPGSRPEYMMAYLSRFQVQELEGERVLAKGPSPVAIHRHITFLGGAEQSDYTIEADLMGTRTGRRQPDLGLINSGYTLELLSVGSRPGSPPGPKLQIRSWQSGLRIAHEVEFPWEHGVWYRMKLRVEEDGGEALVRGKVWRRDAAEPADWSIEVRDPLPILSGNPGLSGYSPTPIYFDNIEVTKNR